MYLKNESDPMFSCYIYSKGQTYPFISSASPE